jgi:GNAT superfamily N-acetyltransferase
MGTEVKSPSDWGRPARKEFEKLVSAGGAVDNEGLSGRIENAAALACHHARGKLLGVAALKEPLESYRKKVSQKSRIALDKVAYPFELGWVYVHPDARGLGLSKHLVTACLAAANSEGVFATTRENNDFMRSCLSKSGFERAGRPYKSERGDDLLVVYVRVEQHV